MVIKRVFSITLIIALLISVCGCAKPKTTDAFKQNRLTVYFFDVGQADSSLLLFPDNTVILIDAGNIADGKEIADFMHSLRIKTIDYFVLTHPHEDHIGGADEIFDEFTVSTVCVPDIPQEYQPDTKIFKDLNKSISKEKCRTLSLKADTIIAEKDYYRVSTVSPGADSVFSDLNNWSLCLSVTCYTNTILFMGDAESPVENDILAAELEIDADIIKVGHHGSETASTEKFLEKVTPQVAVISCGTGNKYNHPQPKALNNLTGAGAKIYRTDTVGTVIAKCYDGGFNIETNHLLILDGNR